MPTIDKKIGETITMRVTFTNIGGESGTWEVGVCLVDKDRIDPDKGGWYWTSPMETITLATGEPVTLEWATVVPTTVTPGFGEELFVRIGTRRFETGWFINLLPAEVPPEVGKLHCTAYTNGTIAIAVIDVDTIGRYYTPFTVELPVGSYHLVAEWLGHVKEADVEILKDQTTEIRFDYPAGYIDCHAYCAGEEVTASVNISGIGIRDAPFLLKVYPKDYHLTATYSGWLIERDITVGMGETIKVNFFFAAPTHALSVDSTPISTVPVTINGVTGVTPFSTSIEEGTYTITVPATVTVEGKEYNFKSWEDGSTEPTRGITITADVSLVATYEEVIPPPPEYTLKIESSPITSVPATLDGEAVGNTPVITSVIEGDHSISVPEEVEI